jgi:hypothetical protein
MEDIYVVKIQEGGLSGCNDVMDSAVVTPLSVMTSTFALSAFSYALYSGSVTPPGSFAPALPRTLLCSHPVGVEERIDLSFSIFPNPTDNVLNVYIPGNTGTQISVINVIGETVLTLDGDDEQTAIDVGSLPAGLYFITLARNGSSSTQKFVKR